MNDDPSAAIAPNANNPRLLRRVVEWVARGIRSPRALQEILGLDLRTIQYYLQAGAWLGLLEPGPEHVLTPVGVEVALGEDPDGAYARAVWSQPLVAGLVAEHGATLPPLDEVILAIGRAEPNLAPATVRRRASAVRSLMAPALDPGRRRRPEHLQLDLPLVPRLPHPPPALHPGRARDADPEVYRFVLGALLDHGELTLGQLRALLDRAGGGDLAIGGYVELALQRADATRRGERLVVTAGAVERRDVASTTAGVILSHPGYRAWLRDLRHAALDDRQAEIRVAAQAPRFRAWDERLLGRPADPRTLDADLAGIILDRSAESYPTACDPGPTPATLDAAWLDLWEQPDLIVSLPPALEVLRGGLPAVNAALAAARQGAREVALPDVASRPSLVHGGLLHPGEPLPRSVPDLISLRQRALMHAPYVAVIAAVLLSHRGAPDRFQVRRRRGVWTLARSGRTLGPLLDVLDTFFLDRGQIPSRRRGAGLGADDLVAGLATIGIVLDLGAVLALDEKLFFRLRTEPEQMEIHGMLRPLVEAIDAHLADLEPLEGRGPR